MPSLCIVRRNEDRRSSALVRNAPGNVTIPVQTSTSFRRVSALADVGHKRYRTPRGVCVANPRVAAFSPISQRLIQLRKRVSIQVSEAF